MRKDGKRRNANEKLREVGERKSETNAVLTSTGWE